MKRFYLWVISHRYKPNGGKHWQYMEGMESPSTCRGCKRKRKHRRYMFGLQDDNKGEVLCIRHYFDRVPLEVDRIMLKLVQPLAIGVLALLLVASGLVYMAFSREKVIFKSAVSGQQIENVVDWAYKRAPNVARGTIRQEVETINAESPNMAFFVLACAVIDTESRWDPGHRGMMRDKKGKLVPSGAGGPGAVVASMHQTEMQKAGCKEDQDLFDPVLGTRTAIECLKDYMGKAKGNTSTALRHYLQGEGTKYQGVDWNMKPEKYFDVTINTEGQIMMVLGMEKK